jgi:excisionase family DNA binding protein
MEPNNTYNKDAPHLLKVPGAAAMLGVSPRTIWRMIADGQLKAVHIRGCTRLYLRSVNEYVKQSEQAGCV